MENNDEEEKESIDNEFTEQKAGPKNYVNAIDFRWSNILEEDREDILRANFIESLKKQTDGKNFSKKQIEDCLMNTVLKLKKKN